ncbi:type II secretion system F family protein [Candidatus Falkowbacteria bacterium]|jgi:type II secretory pathway component PulF|nr:type II secretion system F family protein [Candidatus Falkowbacteria bacterium]MBT7007358.1 type II secretion system F family protein [Candidatus Falkowbacteria bacterium]
MLYKYRAKNIDTGKLLDGLVEAETEMIAGQMLEEQGMTVLFLEKKKKGLKDLNVQFNTINAKDLVIFSRQLSVLISAEVRLVEALGDIAKQTENPKLKTIISEIAHDIENGVRFSDGLAQYPKVFSNYFINIIKSGEASGRLQEVLLNLADQLEKDYDLRAKIKGAMIYPGFIVGTLIVIGTLMMIFVVPRMTEMLIESGAKLPLPTRILIGLSSFLVNYWWLAVLIVIAVVLLIKSVLKTYRGKKFFDIMILKVPIFGTLFQYINVVKFSNGFKTLTLGGVEVVQSLSISALMIDNTVYKEAILQAKDNVEEGGNISSSFEKSDQIPKMLSQMMATGEETGKMEDVLEKLSNFYTREIDNLLKNIMSLIEPIVMILLGVAVLVMFVAILLPMYQTTMSI